MKPIDLTATRAQRGDRDPLACAKALVADLESGALVADELAIVAVKYATQTQGVEVSVRAANQRPSPAGSVDAMGTLAVGQHWLWTASLEPWDDE